MANVTVIGAQWGDEGKGKIVDWLASRADVVVRFQGGHNAGHTLVVGDKVYKLSLLPSGIVRGTLSVIGNGVVMDPIGLIEEINKLRGQGVTIEPDNLLISETCHLVLPYHRALDLAREVKRGDKKIGTTGRGIGPAYADKVERSGIRAILLTRPAELEEELRHRIAGGLSHGQKQWLEIGMLLAQDPQLLLVDEPVAGMTDAETEQTADLLRDINRTRSVVVVEHDMAFVRALGVCVTVLHEGSLLSEGTIDHVSNDPKVLEVYLGR
jgi:adenylosuccinate synthase